MSAYSAEMSADDAVLHAQGHRSELPRSFSTFSALSLGFVITNSWIGYSATFISPLWTGGGPAVLYGLIVAAIACLIISWYMSSIWDKG
jgi:choline transport protein